MRKFAPLALLFALGCAPGSAVDLGLPPAVQEALDTPGVTEFVTLRPTPLSGESKPQDTVGEFLVLSTVKPPQGKEGEIEEWLRFAALAPGATAPEAFAPRYGARLTRGDQTYGFALDPSHAAYKVYDASRQELASGTLRPDMASPGQALPWIKAKGDDQP
ncbi:hypothetical protein BH11ARM2_BH11ARM2_07150 [soil metagenome]